MVRTRRETPRKLTTNAFRRILGGVVNHAVNSRLRLIMGEMDGDEGLDPIGRNLSAECGYPIDPTVQTYRRMYDREGYATRVVNLWPDECWAVRPQLYETEDKRVTKFERAWANLTKQIDVWHFLHRLDRLAGIGSFGVMLLGINDGRNLSLPAPGFNRQKRLKARPDRRYKLTYLQVFAEDNVTVLETEKDPANPRFGKPLYYNLKVATPNGIDQSGVTEVRVHWSRVIHFADNCESNNQYGTPRQQPVLNRLLDLRKILGGSGEMYWKGAFPGFVATTQKEVEGAMLDAEQVKDEFERYLNGLQRMMGFDGLDVKQLLPQMADPTQHVMVHIAAICAMMGCPVPVFLGQQEGHLAGMSNATQWNRRVAARNEGVVEGKLIRETVDRFMDVGILPEPPNREYMVAFRDLNTLSDLDKADVALKRAQAIQMWVQGGESAVPHHQFLTMFLGFSEKEAAAVVEAVKQNANPVTDPLGDKKAERDAELQIKVAKATPAQRPIAGSGRTKKSGGGTQGGARRGSANGGRPRGVVSRS